MGFLNFMLFLLALIGFSFSAQASKTTEAGEKEISFYEAGHSKNDYDTHLNSRDRHIQASLLVINKQEALRFWNGRSSSRFLSNDEINQIAFRAFREARRLGLSQAGEIGRLSGALIRSYQGSDFDGWRARVGQFLILGQSTIAEVGYPDGLDEQSIGAALFDLIGAIDFGAIADIINAIILLIQLFL